MASAFVLCAKRAYGLCFHTSCYVRAPVSGARALPGYTCPESTSLGPSALCT